MEHGFARGADEIGFTEHLYRCVEAGDPLGEWWKGSPTQDLAELTAQHIEVERVLSLERYVEAVVDAKDRGLPVLLGLEVDFFPDTIGPVLDLLAPYPFDFLIGSVHWIGAWGIDLPEQVYEFDRRGHRQAYEDYFALETELAASGAVDVLAHCDAAKKRGVYLDEMPHDLYETLAAAAGRSGVAVEVSTAGLYQPAAEMYPKVDLLKRFHDHGVPITISSDAHFPEDCGRDRDLARDMARSVGYKTRVTFRNRVPQNRPL